MVERNAGNCINEPAAPILYIVSYNQETAKEAERIAFLISLVGKRQHVEKQMRIFFSTQFKADQIGRVSDSFTSGRRTNNVNFIFK